MRRDPLTFVALTACLATCGCGKSSVPEFRAMVKKVEAGELDTIDCRNVSGIGDAQIIELTKSSAINNLRELILDDSAVTNEGIKFLPWLPNLTQFSASKTPITDAGVAHLPKVGNLQFLRLDQTRTTDSSLQTIGRMKSLRTLSLWRCAVTDDGLAHLKDLSQLESLSLDETGVTATGVRRLLPKLSSLKHLSVWQTKVRPADVDSLKQGNPNLRINFGD